MLEELRKKSYWCLDALKGGSVQKAYDQIKEFDCLDSDDPKVEEHQVTAWDQLRSYAIYNTEFYKDIRADKLEDFPVIDKNIIKSRQDEFISAQYHKDCLIKMSTSGSTGTPFICYQNPYKKKRVNAEIIYYSEKAGYSLGSNLTYIRTIVRQVKKPLWKQFLQNQYLLNCERLDHNSIQNLLETIKKRTKHHGTTLLAYGSTYTAIKNYIRDNDLKGQKNIILNGAISGSDMLYDETREAMKSFFGCEVVSRYSNEENGVLGQDEGVYNVFTLNEANYIIEILDDDNNRLPDGQVGRIVVTDLYNYGMPMIRYDTGDAGAIKVVEINGRKKRSICNFVGRKVDMIYDTAGKLLSPHVVTNHMWRFTQVKQFQFIQENQTSYTIKLNISDSERERTAPAILEALYSIVGADAEIHIEYVDEIPALRSGKYRYVVNNWRK